MSVVKHILDEVSFFRRRNFRVDQCTAVARAAAVLLPLTGGRRQPSIRL
jgi:hypothetical protein